MKRLLIWSSQKQSRIVLLLIGIFMVAAAVTISVELLVMSTLNWKWDTPPYPRYVGPGYPPPTGQKAPPLFL